MDMGSQQASGVVHADYHTYWLIERDFVTPEPGPRPLNGLISPQQGAAEIWAGTHTGNVAITVEVRDSPPPDVDLGSWDEVVEVDLESMHGMLQVTSMFVQVEPELPILTPNGPGLYRVRAHAVGRDSGEFTDLQAPLERHLLVTWPVDHDTEEVAYKQTDQYGQALRDVARGKAG